MYKCNKQIIILSIFMLILYNVLKITIKPITLLKYAIHLKYFTLEIQKKKKSFKITL